MEHTRALEPAGLVRRKTRINEIAGRYNEEMGIAPSSLASLPSRRGILDNGETSEEQKRLGRFCTRVQSTVPCEIKRRPCWKPEVKS